MKMILIGNTLLSVVIFIFLLIVAFYPRYDLEISYDIDFKKHSIVETNFLSLEHCKNAAYGYNATDWICLKHTLWGEMNNKYSKYDSKHR